VPQDIKKTSGMYRLKCKTCYYSYIGQTGGLWELGIGNIYDSLKLTTQILYIHYIYWTRDMHMEESLELLETCTRDREWIARNHFLYKYINNRVYWSKNRSSMTSILFTRWRTSPGGTETISQKPVFIPSSVPNKPSCQKHRNYGKPVISYFVILVLHILLKYCSSLQDQIIRGYKTRHRCLYIKPPYTRLIHICNNYN
jgi:hypothetical protein